MVVAAEEFEDAEKEQTQLKTSCSAISYDWSMHDTTSGPRF